ncbi:hypothetical protein [Singulisphaera acidiphila]|uniref:Uncharacterized protein n=1 Tax=Singulisphaera acidiphila (strain ATCC BAA-1392 / DSM 18658 / VKM B-2454 / MOB10) TaxID=886293 RepID=L0DKJ6_SINAD|nr:hypothetical protein [Singulisphaera acidiphila]AGA29889.1 hypothetical protein Sinac_5759 [Singulisphaera acidiphila DSM 18658]
MSGPIIRKYGFPNFENIFGARELEHGVDEQGQAEAAAPASSESKTETGSTKPAPAKSTSNSKKPS